MYPCAREARKGDGVRTRFLPVIWMMALVSLAVGQSQTFEINKEQAPPSGQKSSSNSKQNIATGNQGLGWGSSIEVSRQARAVQDALKRGDYAAATKYAEQAANSAPQNTELWFLLGYCARLAGRYPESVEAYQHGLQNQPNSTAGLTGLAQTYARMGRHDEAKNLLLRAVPANSRDPNSLQLAGELLLESDPGQALEFLRRAEAVQASPRTELLLARACQGLNRPDEAAHFLALAKKGAPHDPEILRVVAGQYRENGQFEQAISTLKAVSPKTPEVQAELAYTYELAGKTQQAAELYSQLATAAKGNVELALNAAQALVNLGQFETAHAFLERVMQLNGNHYRLHAILGQIASAEDRNADAIREYQLALDHLPSSVPEGPLYPVQLRMNLYELYEQNDNATKAKQQLSRASAELEQARVSGQANPEFLRLRAAIASASGDLEAAHRDLQEALSAAPSNVNIMLNYGNLLWKMGRKDEAHKIFEQALSHDRRNRVALTSLGYLAREMGETKAAEEYFSRVAALYPKDFAPQFALADLYASQRNNAAAEEKYEAAYQRRPNNPSVVAGGAAAAIEGHNLDLAKRWLDRATGPMNDNPQLMRERARYLTLTNKYEEAAPLGFKVLEKLPRDPEAPIYLAYDLYYLGRFDEVRQIVARYEPILPRDKDLALLSGYLHVRDGQEKEALADFNRALEIDPKIATGYVSRGTVLNDLRQPQKAISDFKTALQLRSDYGEAHLGLAYSYLQLHRPRLALVHLDKAEGPLGRPRVWHLARAEAYRQQGRFSGAEKEYRAALEEKPDDLTTQLALADTLFHMRRYRQSLDEFEAALKISPLNPVVYAEMAQASARLGQREQALHYIETAEENAKQQASVLMATGDALLTMGEREPAMQRFSQALDDPEADRIGLRLDIAQTFVQEARWDDARRQIGLGFAEARIGEAKPPTADDFVTAANILLAMHDYELAREYFARAQKAGANERVIALGLANTYLAQGDNRRAEGELARLGNPQDYKDDYDYTMVRMNLYRQRQDTVHALSAVAQATQLAGPDTQGALQAAQYDLAGQEGRQINQQVSVFPTGSFEGVLEDLTVYELDAKILGVTNKALLPPPRHSYESFGAAHYRLHLKNFLPITGFVGQSLTTGKFSFPSTFIIQDRNTFDTVINGGVSPILRLGSNTLAFNGGLQFTIRRDTQSPRDLNQNLFRQFLYLSTSSFFNWVSVQGSAAHETGPFLDQSLHSRDALANIEFKVGRPWGRTSVITGYFVRDLLFHPAVREYYTTSMYAGVQRKFGDRLTVAGFGEYLRSWRVFDSRWGIAQALRPAARFEYRANSRWSVQGAFSWSRGEGFHDYDNAASEFLVSYVRPVHRRFNDGTGNMSIEYPFGISVGVQQQPFYNYAGQTRTTLLPVVRCTLF